MSDRITRYNQVILISTFLAFSWLAMIVFHELGHVLAACFTGGKVSSVVLHPLSLSKTEIYPNNKPLVVAWGGPVLGVCIPLIIASIAQMTRMPGLYMFQFFAGFCLLVNGTVLGLGSLRGLGEAGDMLLYGAHKWQLIVFGLVAVAVGMYTCKGTGPGFGFGKTHGRVHVSAMITSAILLTLLVIAELIYSGSGS